MTWARPLVKDSLQPFTGFGPEWGVRCSLLFSVELRPEPAAEKKAVNDRLIPSPSPRPLPKGEGEPLGSSGRAECAKAFGRVGDGRAAMAPSFGAWDRSRHSPSLDEAFACSPSPRGLKMSHIFFAGHRRGCARHWTRGYWRARYHGRGAPEVGAGRSYLVSASLGPSALSDSGLARAFGTIPRDERTQTLGSTGTGRSA
jgi:hypothetical protein